MSQPANGWATPPAQTLGGSPNTAVGMPNNSAGFDIWGPLQRRKYLIALFCAVGAALGYLSFTKTPKTYASNTQLMITVQAPPSFVDGSFKLDQVSLPKHSTLLTSEVVLADASREGKFKKLNTFGPDSNPVGDLKEMLRVIPGEKETLTIVLNGPDPEELPTILNHVVGAYKKIIVEDSETIGQQTVDMIRKLETKLSDEQESADSERIALQRKLGLKSVDENGQVVNPYTKKYFDLLERQDSLKQSLREIQQRARLLTSSLKVDEETGIIDPVRAKVAALAAQEYLKLARADFKEEVVGSDHVERSLTSEIQQRNLLQSRAWAFETRITDLRIEKSKKADVFGPGHKASGVIDNQIRLFTEQKQEVESTLEKLEAYIAAERQKNGGIDDPDAIREHIDLETFRSREDQEWITMYQLALEQEQEKLVLNLKDLTDEVSNVSKNAEDVAEDTIKLNLLNSAIEDKRQAVNAIVDRLGEMDVLAGNYTMTKVRTLDEPKIGLKVAPSLAKSLALGTMLAFLAGFGLAILIDQSELSFHNPQEIFEKLQIPVVGRIPRINIRKMQPVKGNPALVVAHKPSATASESFRDIRTSLFFRANAEDIKMILFTSPSPGDGKSTTIANMAISMAQAGKRVILVDADLRRPRVHQYFDEELSPGLLDVLSGECSLKEAIKKTDLQKNLYLLSTGGRPKNPGELVTSKAFRELLAALRKRFDYVLIDSPPVLPVADPASIASLVDGVYLVTRIRKGVRLTLQKAKETLDRVNAPWMGIIINGVDENPHYSEYGYQYGGYSYYGGVYGRYYESHNKAYRDKVEEPTEK